MDQTQEQMKFLGTLGIFNRSLKTIFTYKKIFSQITFTLIVPLALIFIIHMDFSSRFFYKIEDNPYQLITGAFQRYKSYYNANVTRTVWLKFVLFKMITIAAITIFSFISTSVIVYTIASLYTGRDITFSKALKVVPKVWKRLMATLLSMFLTLFAYNLIASVVMFLCKVILIDVAYFFPVWLVMSIMYIYWFLYLIIVWELASVVSVLEASCGLKAAIKAMDLMDGKKKVALMVSFMLYLFLGGVVFVYMVFFMYDDVGLEWVWLGLIKMVFVLMFVIGFLLIMLVQTMLYLVCKSHHQESIDPVSLSTYLGAYLSDSQPVFRVAESIQLGRPQNQPLSQI